MSVVLCKFHPTVEAVNNCSQCHSAICLNDVRKYRGYVYCPKCFGKVQHATRRNVFINYLAFFGFIIIAGLDVAIFGTSSTFIVVLAIDAILALGLLFFSWLFFRN